VHSRTEISGAEHRLGQAASLNNTPPAYKLGSETMKWRSDGCLSVDNPMGFGTCNQPCTNIPAINQARATSIFIILHLVSIHYRTPRLLNTDSSKEYEVLIFNIISETDCDYHNRSTSLYSQIKPKPITLFCMMPQHGRLLTLSSVQRTRFWDYVTVN
jgi:hypothetical protein